MTSAREVAEANTILRAMVGSTVHGLNLPGADDRDEMGVCIEPPEHVIGLRYFEQWVHRTQPEGVRSGPGDLDVTIYGLRKYVRLALGGNPTILLLLFVPTQDLLIYSPAGEGLRDLTPQLISRRAGRAFLGYLTQQKQRLLGERGQKRTKRPELEAVAGYDTKYAMHMLRLGFQGVELLRTGRLTLPMPGVEREHLMRVRRGEEDLAKVLRLTEDLERELEGLLVTSALPVEPDHAAATDFLVREYRDHWWEERL